MTKKTKQPTPTRSNLPAFIAYQVTDNDGEGEERKSYWTRIGAVFAHGDGNGFNLEVSLLPLDGRIVLRKFEERPKTEGQTEDKPKA